MQPGFDSDLLQITVFLPETFTGLDSRCVPPYSIRAGHLKHDLTGLTHS